MVRVIYIAGAQRSGTTVLGNVLATASGAEHVGELEYLRKPTARGGRECGCSELIEDCPIWSRVVSDPSLDLARWQQVRKATTRIRHLPRLIYRWRRYSETFEYAKLRGDLYKSIGNCGIETVIDSSKRAVGALSAYVAPGVETYVLHVVRDPRAVAYSRSSRVKRHGAHGTGEQMVKGSVAATSRYWLTCNGAIEAIAKASISKDHYRMVKYEDIMSNPRVEFSKLLDWVGLNRNELDFTGPNSVSLRPTHTVHGNPNRFFIGETDLTLDDEWKQCLDVGARSYLTAACSPLLARYGYPLSTGSSA